MRRNRQVWCRAIVRLRPEGCHEFEDSLCYIMSPVLKNPQRKKRSHLYIHYIHVALMPDRTRRFQSNFYHTTKNKGSTSLG